MSTTYDKQYWISQVMRTRRFGHTYVHVGARGQAPEIDGVRFSYCGWGRSLQTGGHKYKVHATCVETGKPVKTKTLKAL